MNLLGENIACLPHFAGSFSDVICASCLHSYLAPWLALSLVEHHVYHATRRGRLHYRGPKECSISGSIRDHITHVLRPTLLRQRLNTQDIFKPHGLSPATKPVSPLLDEEASFSPELPQEE